MGYWKVINERILLVSLLVTGASVLFLAFPVTAKLESMLSRFSWSLWSVLTTTVLAFAGDFGARADGDAGVDLGWYPPTNTSVNNLTTALHGTGIYGFIFNSSNTPTAQYGTYNWCNMPHVRRTEYIRAAPGYDLRYVEVVSSISFSWSMFPQGEASHWSFLHCLPLFASYYICSSWLYVSTWVFYMTCTGIFFISCQGSN